MEYFLLREEEEGQRGGKKKNAWKRDTREGTAGRVEWDFRVLGVVLGKYVFGCSDLGDTLICEEEKRE